MMFPGIQFERVPWYANNKWTVPALFTCLGILGLVFITSIIRLGRRLFFRRRPKLEPQPGTIWLTFGPRSAAWVWFLFLCSILAFFVIEGNDMLPPTPAWFPWFVVINWVTGLAIFLSFFAVFAAIRIWFRSDLRWITKVKFDLRWPRLPFLELVRHLLSLNRASASHLVLSSQFAVHSPWLVSCIVEYERNSANCELRTVN